MALAFRSLLLHPVHRDEKEAIKNTLKERLSEEEYQDLKILALMEIVNRDAKSNE